MTTVVEYDFCTLYIFLSTSEVLQEYADRHHFTMADAVRMHCELAQTRDRFIARQETALRGPKWLSWAVPFLYPGFSRLFREFDEPVFVNGGEIKALNVNITRGDQRYLQQVMARKGLGNEGAALGVVVAEAGPLLAALHDGCVVLEGWSTRRCLYLPRPA